MNRNTNGNWLLLSFDYLIKTHMPHIQYIAWDLDGTLGKHPGWDGTGSVKDYIIDHPSLREAMQHLTRKYGIGHIVVSRNGMFCGNTYNKMRAELQQLGFHGVLKCYRKKDHSKVREFYMQNGDPPSDVLLIDDQERECVAAQNEGAYALLVETYVQDALPNNKFTIYIPDTTA